MTDNEIVKTLEAIASEAIGDCKRDCAFYDGRVHYCAGVISRYALDLINRQKAEIERYKENMPYLEQQSLDFCGVLCDFAEELIAKYKSEAVKKFAERLKADLGDPFLRAHGCVESIIDDLVKEMTEEAK